MSLDEKDDTKLLKELKLGNEQSFKLIYLKYHKQLYSVAFRYLRSKDLAEDAVHNIFLNLWDYRKKLDTSESLSGFLFISVKNEVLNTISKKKRKLKKHILLAYEKKQRTSESTNIFSLAEYKEHYQIAIEQLPEKRREIFELRVKDGLTNKEIAGYLGISLHTVKSQYYKASLFIRDYVTMKIKKETCT